VYAFFFIFQEEKKAKLVLGEKEYKDEDTIQVAQKRIQPWKF